MAFYDYIPLAGSIARLAQGNYKQAAIDAVPVLGPAVQYASDKVSSAIDQKNQGYSAAQTMLAQLAQRQKDFQMQGLGQAEGYYQPVADRINATYGDPGSFRK